MRCVLIIIWSIKSLVLWEILDEKWFWTIQKSKCTISTEVGGVKCVWLQFRVHPNYHFFYFVTWTSCECLWKTLDYYCTLKSLLIEVLISQGTSYCYCLANWDVKMGYMVVLMLQNIVYYYTCYRKYVIQI